MGSSSSTSFQPDGTTRPGLAYIFFIISGCVITESLIRDQAHFGRFIVRRIFRIIPAMVGFIALSYDLNHFLAQEVGYPLGPIPEVKFWTYALASLTGLVQPFQYFNIAMPVPFMFGHIWSLSVEDIFYLVFGALAGTVLLRMTPQRSILLIATALLVILVARALAWTGTVPWHVVTTAANAGDLSASLLRVLLLPIMLPANGGMDFILGGILVACIARRLPATTVPPKAITDWAVTALILLNLLTLAASGNVTTSPSNTALIGLPIALICAGFAVFLCWRNPQPLTGQLGRILKHVGDLSYSLYLVHLPIAALASSILYRVDIMMQHSQPGKFAILFFFCYAAIPCVLALMSYRWIERPMIAKGREIAKRIGGTSAKPAPT